MGHIEQTNCGIRRDRRGCSDVRTDARLLSTGSPA